MILSFDIGIKNMGVCLMTKKKIILYWNVITLSPVLKNVIQELDILVCCLMEWYDETTKPLIVLERQPSFNVKMKRMFTVLETYFTIHDYTVKSFSSDLKWKMLDIQKPKKYYQRKQESIKCCKQLLFSENTDWIDFYDNCKKRDDLSDCMIQAYLSCR